MLNVRLASYLEELFIRVTVRVFCEGLSVCVCCGLLSLLVLRVGCGI